MHGITPISSTNPSYPTFCNEVFLHYVSNVSSAKWDVNFIGQTKRFLDHKKGSKTKILNQDGEMLYHTICLLKNQKFFQKMKINF